MTPDKDLPQFAADIQDDEDDADAAGHHKAGLGALTLGAIGVVYGDIGTSPLYALREALRPVARDGLDPGEVLGVVSLLIWALVLIVTLKYVLVLLRADNRGEGGILALYTLTRLAIGRRHHGVLALGLVGAALFFGDAMITPAISVLSAVEGVELIAPQMADYVLPVTVGILLGLFLVQRHGTQAISVAFGPVMVLWFVVMGVSGAAAMSHHPAVLAALSPHHGIGFLIDHKVMAFVVLGAVFLAVTGAEALYADLGHFGRAPIQLAWFALVFPALVLNYLGQGASVLADPAVLSNPFFRLVPQWALPALVLLATLATVIAAQAVVSGAFSMARAAVQLGLLPRLNIIHTSDRQSGQIYVPALNWIMLGGVLGFVLGFQTSEALAATYGISVTGAMIVDTILALVFARIGWHLGWWILLPLGTVFLLLEGTFLLSNLAKFLDGGFVPVLLSALMVFTMSTWWRGTQSAMRREAEARVGLETFAKSMAHSSVTVVPGTAFFLTSDPASVPPALLHNLKHNRVLHDHNVVLTVETMRVPSAPDEDRISFAPIDDRFARLVLRFGYMETQNISRALGAARRHGLRFDVMSTSFFLGRRKLVSARRDGWRDFLDRFYIALSRFSADPSDFYHLPRDRVVELGARMTL
ncbi:MAG: potassium transporter Kup [Rhodobacteraceae bacterium]|nr:potassium transporter Kup [Paracoccaceae bacterium]